MTTRSSTPGVLGLEDAERVPDWYGPEVEAVLAVFEATGEKPDPSWRALARDCVAAVWSAHRLTESAQ